MSEVGLFAFQADEMFDAVRYVICGLAFILGASLWVHATFFRKDDE